jgi:hypothetical protein
MEDWLVEHSLLLLSPTDLFVFHWLTGLTGLHRLTSEFGRRTVSTAKNYPILLQLI